MAELKTGNCNNQPQFESCLEYNDNNNCLEFTTNLGNLKVVKLPDPKVTGEIFTVGDKCFLRLFVNNVVCDTVDVTSILDKVVGFQPTFVASFKQTADKCIICLNVNGIEQEVDITSVLDKVVVTPGKLNLKIREGKCFVCYTNSLGDTNEIELPSDDYVYNAAACTLTINDAKGGAPVVAQLGVPATDMCIELDANRDLCFIAKANCICKVVLPNFVTNVKVDKVNCTIVTTFWDGTEEVCAYLEPIALNKVGDAGAFEFSFKGQTCVFNPPSLVPDPNNPNQFLWSNGYGQTTVININEIDMDFNDLSFTGSVFTLTAEDGSQSSIDICAIVAANCNSPMTVNTDGSVTYVDNAGKVTTIPAPAGSTVVDNNDGTGTVFQSDNTQCTFVKGVQSSVVANTAGQGGGVGTATITQNNGSVKNDAVCGVQSTVVASADGTTAEITQNDGSKCRVIKELPDIPVIPDIPEEILCFDMPEGTLTDITADSLTLIAEAATYVTGQLTGIYTDPVTGLSLFKDANGKVCCIAQPSVNCECGWLEYAEDPVVSAELLAGDEADANTFIVRITTEKGVEAIARITGDQGQGFNGVGVNANTGLAAANLLTDDSTYSYDVSVTKYPTIRSANGCKVKIATAIEFLDLDVSSTIRGNSQWGESFPLPSVSLPANYSGPRHGAFNSGAGDINPAYANVDTPIYFDLQSVYPNNQTPGGLDVISMSTTAVNILSGTFQSNGAGPSDAISIRLRSWCAESVDICRGKDGEIAEIKSASGTVVDESDVVYSIDDCLE